jgi:hypothetical protein
MDKGIDTGTRDLLKGQNMRPEKRTAFLIIHGIGEQNPFETMDAFVKGFFKVIEQNNKDKEISIKHCIKPRTKNDKIEWIENYISIVREDRPECPVDFYEYYWAHYMEDKITFAEIMDWLIKTSDGARKFYHENLEIVKEYEGKKDDAFKGGEFKKQWYLKHTKRSWDFENYWYLKYLSGFLQVLIWLPSVILRIAAKVPYMGSILEVLRPVFNLLINKYFVKYMGNVAIYTTTDVKSKHYAIRKAILDESVGTVRNLINDERYKNIIIAGHSLGSVIAYDVLNRVNHEMNVGAIDKRLRKKLYGFVTFGSPLDKTAFFFREQIPKEQYIRKQILAHFHSFKIRDLNLLSYFCLDEFKPPLSVKELCKAIERNTVKISLNARRNTIPWLNELLNETRLCDILKPVKGISEELEALVNKAQTYHDKSYVDLSAKDKINITDINRLLLEKAYPEQTPKNPERVTNPIKPLLDHMAWINFWDENDPVSGNLDFYVVHNIPLVMGKKYGISHIAYWEYEEMYSKIYEHFLRSDSIV